MNIHEYQAKQLFAEYGIPVPSGMPVRSVSEATNCAAQLGGKRWVVKAQVHAGGRGKGGGIKLVDSLEELAQASEALIGSRLVTPQTDNDGLPVDVVMIEELQPITRELYLSALVDRGSSRIMFMGSAAGGMDIEKVAEETPEKILTTRVDPAAGLQSYQCRNIGFSMDLTAEQIGVLVKIMQSMYQLFIDKDASQIELNPLVVTDKGDLLALDAKINFDDNALYAHKDIIAMRDSGQEDEKEAIAQQHDLSYVTLDGNIGCMVNGAGLAMATLDLVKLKGGEPANFLDVGGGTTTDKVAAAFKLILSDTKVKAVLVNIFGGIVRCDVIAEGIIQAVKNVSIKVPVVVRLEGTNAKAGRSMLERSGLDIIAAPDLAQAAEQAVHAASA